MNTKDVGDIAVAMVLAALVRVGHVVLTPFGDNRRYDLVIDDEGRFKRIQCKNGLLKNGAVSFRCCSSYAHRGRGRKHYQGEIDMFGVYCPQTNRVYLVPIEECSNYNECSLRVEPAKNNQQRKVRWAKQYEIA